MNKSSFFIFLNEFNWWYFAVSLINTFLNAAFKIKFLWSTMKGSPTHYFWQLGGSNNFFLFILLNIMTIFIYTVKRFEDIYLEIFCYSKRIDNYFFSVIIKVILVLFFLITFESLLIHSYLPQYFLILNWCSSHKFLSIGILKL